MFVLLVWVCVAGVGVCYWGGCVLLVWVCVAGVGVCVAGVCVVMLCCDIIL